MKALVGGLAFLLLLLNFWVKASAPFGVDVERYDVILREGVLEWSAYYLKEWVSWGAMDLLSALSPHLDLAQQLMVLDLVVAAVVGLACRNAGFVGHRFAFFYVSFAFVLLSFNVLRQYVAFALLAGAAVAAVNERPRRTLLLALLALFAHNGSLLLLPALLPVFLRRLRATYRVMGALLVLAAVVLLSLNDAVLAAFETGADVLEEPFWKIALYAGLSLYLVWLARLRRREVAGADSAARLADNVQLQSAALFAMGLLVSLTPFTNWIISRNWISVLALQSFLYLCYQGSGRYTRASVLQFVWLYFLPMGLLLFLHSGARQMMFRS
ncbi:EpsG family protein [Xenophilus sp. Marseille-Q4582]|uniref:EpsG family protein n=1 Tax=Xenophilus sp. Marseille-Q4582 TaxID=2866600 RepID=UPI001CE47879|nr:EpsG family protein [Xenophilus sp. Marseille-Q4582]